MTPPNLTARLHSLPPMLHRSLQTSTSSCSKAPRGLFVLLRVGRIYTASSISPSPWLRQRSSRYTIRAGQNLPDKEFRLSILPELAGRTVALSYRPCMSPCRWDHIIVQVAWTFGVWSLRGHAPFGAVDFPADCLHQADCHCFLWRVPLDSQGFQQTAKCAPHHY